MRKSSDYVGQQIFTHWVNASYFKIKEKGLYQKNLPGSLA